MAETIYLNMPTLRLKGNTMKKRPSWGHLTDSDWMSLTNHFVGSHAYPKLMENRNQSFKGVFDADNFMSLLREISKEFVASGAASHATTASMSRTVNGIVTRLCQIADNLAEMSDFASANPDVVCVKSIYSRRQTSSRYFGDLPPHPALMDGYDQQFTNYVEFRKWILNMGDGDFNAGVIRIHSMSASIVATGDLFKKLLKGDKTLMVDVRNTIISNAIENYFSFTGGASHPNVPIPSNFGDLTHRITLCITNRTGFFTTDELWDSDATSNPILDNPLHRLRVAQTLQQHMIQLDAQRNAWTQVYSQQ